MLFDFNEGIVFVIDWLNRVLPINGNISAILYLFFVFLFGVLHPTLEFFTYMEMSLLPVKGF